MLNRRDFVRTTAAAAALGVPAIRAHAKVDPAYTTALIGGGWWGTNILREALRAGSKSVAICDPDRRQAEICLAEVGKVSGQSPKIYRDYREMLDREKPQVVIVATPDHWHPLAMIDSVKAGAHVYVEKPISHTIDEGKAMVKAAREAGKTVQVGTHRRVSPHNVSGMEFLRSGKAGKVGMVRAFVHYGGGEGQVTPDSDVPKGLDWDLWCGPAPLVPFNAKMHPKGFRSFLNYANGTLGDWGIHWMDQILWWSGEKAPRKVASFGARHINRDNTDAPDTQVAQFEFENFTAVWEHRQYAANEAERTNVGCYFYGTEGTFHMGWLDGWTFYPADTRKASIHQAPTLHEPDQQNIRELWADFLGAIASGKPPISDIEVGHRSTSMSLLGMLSMKLGRSVRWDAEAQRVVGDEEANGLLRRAYRSPHVYPTA